MRENKDWWDDECQHLKRTKYINQYRHSRLRDDLDTYLAAKRIFKNTCKRKEQHFKNILLDKLKYSVHTSNFWNFVKDCKSNKNTISSNIKPEQWLNHFKDLLNRDTKLANEFSIHVNDENNVHVVACDACDANEPDILNHDIREDEILIVIQNLATGKSPGIDGIVYELYAHSIDILIEPICL